MSEQPTKVLIVEDRDDHAVLIKALMEEGLKEHLLEVDHVTSGDEGLTHLESGLYDICLLDFDLGNNVNGLSILEEVRSNGDQTPVIMLTSMGSEEIAVQAMKAGARDYLRKESLSPELLRSSVRYALDLHKEEILRKDAQDKFKTANEQLASRVTELNDANEHLRRLSRLKDDFVGTVSHELRTPMSNLRLTYQLMMAHPDARDNYLSMMHRDMERLHFIIEQLLNVARMDLEPAELNLTTVDLNTLVLLFVADRTLLAEERGLSLTFKAQEGLPKVRADRLQIERVLGIILTNALNYTPNGGKVWVSTLSDHAEDGKLWCGFSVSDDGPGIPSDEQERVFERFFRGSTALKNGVPGTGLGLSIAKEIVDHHEGKVVVESQAVAGKGSTFSVWLPSVQEESKSEPGSLMKRLRGRVAA